MEYKINYELIGKRIKERRTKINVTQEALAEKAEVTPHHISNVENNKTKVSLPCLVAIANALETTADYLLMDNIETISLPHLIGELKTVTDDCSPEEIYIITEIAKTVKKGFKTKNIKSFEL